MQPSYYPYISTARIIIRIPTVDEAEALLQFEIDNIEHLAPWEPIKDDSFYTKSHCKWRLEQAAWLFEHNRAVRLAVFEKESGDMIGHINFFDMVRGAFFACRLGYKTHVTYQGKGYMTEALRAAIRYMFTERYMHRIMASYIPHNERSKRLLARLGFEEEGFAKDYLYINGQWEDHTLTALVNHEWRKPKTPPPVFEPTLWEKIKSRFSR